MTDRTDLEPRVVSVERVIDLLAHGEMESRGLVPWSSNYTFFVSLTYDDLQGMAVYKPSSGEQPLWDFTAGSLCRREVASYVVCQALGWPDIPPVVLRDGPDGIGSVQLYVGHDPNAHYFTMRDVEHFEVAFQRIALFDALVNNADRKGGHLLLGEQGRVWAIDHGLTFHVEPKLRTVIWDYAGRPIPEEWLAHMLRLREELVTEGELWGILVRLLSVHEVEALVVRIDDLVRDGCFPQPRPAWRNVPYPLV
ncbi:MAG: SCO1664 family protein [Anaerolineae bacterium]